MTFHNIFGAFLSQLKIYIIYSDIVPGHSQYGPIYYMQLTALPTIFINYFVYAWSPVYKLYRL